jgi:hypothetical protein
MNSRGDVVPFRPNNAPEPLPPFEPFYVSQLEGRPIKPREWLVDGILMRKTVCLFAGPPKIGKSLLAQQLLTAAALGVPWLGRQVVQSRSFGLFTEDPEDEVHRRQIDCNAHYGRSAADFELEMSLDPREGKDAMLVEFERNDRPKYTGLWYQLWNYVAAEGIKIVALDTAAVVFGGNENYRSQVTAFMRALVQKAGIMDGGIILTSHPSKGGPGGYSGSTGWLGSARFGMSLGRPPEWNEETGEPDDIRVLRGLGANYGVGMRPQRLQYRDGVFATVEREEGGGGARAQRGPKTHAEWQELKIRLLRSLKYVVHNGGIVPADVVHHHSLPSRCRKGTDPALTRAPLNDLNIAQDEMLKAGQIILVMVKRRVLVRAADGRPYEGEEPFVE